MELVKLFDCQKMPENIQKAFFKLSEVSLPNAIVISHWVYEDSEWDHKCIVRAWLLKNGAVKGEYVYIKRWW